jgi:hypothetical protein
MNKLLPIQKELVPYVGWGIVLLCLGGCQLLMNVCDEPCANEECEGNCSKAFIHIETVKE